MGRVSAAQDEERRHRTEKERCIAGEEARAEERRGGARPRRETPRTEQTGDPEADGDADTAEKERTD